VGKSLKFGICLVLVTRLPLWVFFCSSNDVDGAIAKIKEMGIKAYAIGSVIPDSESSVIVEPKSIKGMGEQFQAI